MDRKRLVALSLFIFLLFSILIAEFYWIQVIEGEQWANKAKRQHYFTVIEPFLRGSFFSNSDVKKEHPSTPHPLVVDIQKYHLFIDPESIPEHLKEEIAKKLDSLIHFESLSDVLTQFEAKSRSRRVQMWLDKEQMDAILAWWNPYSKKQRLARNALFFVTDYQRCYPYGKLLGQVLQTVQHQRDETTKQAIPTGGLELTMHQYLMGKEGQRSLMRSPRNSLETGKITSLPENGADIYLTINHVLQEIVEEELEKGVKKCQAKGGWAVMMDPYTGEIFALAQYPFFNPTEYPDYFNDPEKIAHTRVHAVVDANEPGSVMKPITAAIALKANETKKIFSPEEKTKTRGVKLKGRKQPLRDGDKHGFLNLPMAIRCSSNVYVAQLVERVIDNFGNEWYRNALTELFGFGKKTGVELPAEAAGMVPTPGKKHPNGCLEWSSPTPYSLSFGHNIQVNSLQVIRAYAIFANGGFFVQPTLIRKVVKNDLILLDNTEQREFPRVLSQEIVAEIVKSLKYTTKPGGSCSRGDVYGYTEAGKSGTAHKIINGNYSETQYCSTFVGFTPVIKPAFVLLVTMDEPQYHPDKRHHGGVCASPVFAAIAKRSLDYLGITPDDPYGYHPLDPRYDKNRADWQKENQQLKEMYEKWNNKGQSS